MAITYDIIQIDLQASEDSATIVASALLRVNTDGVISTERINWSVASDDIEAMNTVDTLNTATGGTPADSA